MLNGLIKPDGGRIEMIGRVGALIALGAGFNPILTGRENIYINGSVLGLSKKEIDAKIDEIIDFSEIGEFIDMPVQNYSSGMTVRLGFSVASSLSPDVLILDEVLAVGDIGFVIKCLNRVRKITANAAVILVSHNMQSVSAFCSRVIFMGHGRCLLDTAKPAEAIDRYYEMISAETSETGTGEARIHEISLGSGQLVHQGQTDDLRLGFEISPSCDSAHVHVYIMDEAMSPVVCLPVHGMDGELRTFGSGQHHIILPLGPLDLASGKYSFTVSINDRASRRALIRAQGLHGFRVFADKAHWGRVVRPIVAT
jgi:lipopolysaccharide transport system ATP-binding protein